MGQSCLNDTSSTDSDGEGGGSSGDDSEDGSGSGGSDGENSAAASNDTPIDPNISLSDTTQAGGTGTTGRLSWREIVF